MCDSVREETNRGGEVLGLIDVLCRNSCSCASFVLECVSYLSDTMPWKVLSGTNVFLSL